jgi:hypothetical protein
MLWCMPLQFALLFLLALQDAPPKAAWEWTNEERIAARKDPVLRIQRREEAFAAGDLERSDKRDVLVGRRNPELFLPTELMNNLKGAYRPDAKRRAREQWAPGTHRFGDDFWERLFAAGRPFFEADVRHLQLQRRWQTQDAAERERAQDELSSVSDSLCPLRMQALRAARETFGHEAFDRFLYEVVATTAVLKGSSSGRDGPFSHLWEEEGCP